METDYNYDNNKYNIYMIWIIYFAINLVIATQTKIMTIIPDELNPVGIAAKLAGYDWSTAIVNYKNYYGYGQSIFYTPLLYFIDDGIILYKSMIILNSFFLSFIPVIAYYITKIFFDIKDKKSLFLITMASSLQPGYLILSKYAWNETFVPLLFWLVLLFFCRCYLNSENSKKNVLDSVGLASSLIYGYAVHGRFLAILVATIMIIVIYRIVFKKSMINNIAFVFTLIIAYFIDKVLKKYFLENVWLVNDASELRNTFSETMHRLLETIDIHTIISCLRAANGYLFYLLIASLGLVILGVFLLIRLIKKAKTGEDKDMHMIFFGGFAYLSMLGAMCVAILFFSSNFVHTNDFYVYGRYTEYTVGSILLFVFVYLTKYGINKKDLVYTLVLMVLSCIVTTIIERTSINGGSITNLNTFTLYSYQIVLSISNVYKFMMATVTCVAITAILYVLIVKKCNTYALGFIILVFIVSYLRVGYFMNIRFSNGVFDNVEMTYNFFDSKNLEINKEYKKVYLYDDFPVYYQLLLKDYALYPSANEKTEILENTFITSKKGFKLSCDYDKLYLLDIEKPNDRNYESILVYGNELHDLLVDKGYNFIDFTYQFGDTINIGDNAQAYSYTLDDGWSNKESWGVWSENNISSISFALDELPDKDVEVQVELGAFNGDKAVAVYANGIFMKNIVVSGEGNNIYSIVIPEECVKSKELTIEFNCTDKLLSPSELGTSSDDRTLGISLISIVLNLVDGSTVENKLYLSSQELKKYLGEGWSVQESWGVWSESQECGMTLKQSKYPNEDVKLTFNANAYNSNKTMDIFINDNFLEELIIESSGNKDYTLEIPASYVQNDLNISVIFKFKSELLSPQDLGQGDDTRKLGIGITTITLE